MNSSQIFDLLHDWSEPLGLEAHLFKLSWYNEKVSPSFQIQVDGNTVCAVILSTPSFFEKCFLPFIEHFKSSELNKDPIDSCIATCIDKFTSSLSHTSTTAMYDYELLPNRRPKVLVQTAAHVAGAAFYYQKKHVLLRHCAEEVNGNTNSNLIENVEKSDKKHIVLSNTADAIVSDSSVETSTLNKNKIDFVEETKDPWEETRKIFGVCIHPLYGGWFAIRCVVIFHDILDPNLKRPHLVDCVPLRNDRIELLNRFNNNWKDWTFRDIISVKERYSDVQKKYFLTLPKDRINFLKGLGANYSMN